MAAAAEANAGARSSTLWALALYQLLANNRGGLFVVYMPVFLVEARGAPAVLALALVSAGYVGASLTGPLAGRWSDRLGRRKPFLLAGELSSLPVFLSIPFLPGVWGAGTGFIVAEVLLSLSAPALNAFVADISAQGRRGQGYALLNASASLGSIVGFVAAAILIVPFGLNVLFYFVGAVMVGTVSVILWAVPDLPSPRTVASARRPGEYRRLTIFSTVVSIRSLGAGAVGTFYGVDALSLGANAFDVGLIAIAGFVAAALVSLPFGRFIDRRGEIRSIFYGTLVMLVGLGFFLFATSWVDFVPGQVARLVGFAFLGPAMLSFVSRTAPTGQRAEFLGTFTLINSTLWSLGPLAGAAALALGGSPALFGFAVGTTLISVLAIEGVYRGRERGEPSEPPAAAVEGAPRAPVAGGAK
jgi:MFS family permease